MNTLLNQFLQYFNWDIMPAIILKYEAIQMEAGCLSMCTSNITFILLHLFVKHFCLTSKWSNIACCSSHFKMAPPMLNHDPLLT